MNKIFFLLILTSSWIEIVSFMVIIIQDFKSQKTDFELHTGIDIQIAKRVGQMQSFSNSCTETVVSLGLYLASLI